MRLLSRSASFTVVTLELWGAVGRGHADDCEHEESRPESELSPDEILGRCRDDAIGVELYDASPTLSTSNWQIPGNNLCCRLPGVERSENNFLSASGGRYSDAAVRMSSSTRDIIGNEI